MTIYKPERPAAAKSVVVRAFELARTGGVADVQALKRRLYAEGYARSEGQHLSPSLRKQLRSILGEARANNMEGSSGAAPAAEARARQQDPKS